MIRKITVLFSVLFCITLMASDSGKRQKVLRIIDEEMAEATRLNNQIRGTDPKVILRIAELNLEKARLIREYENRKYLKLSLNTRQKVNKNKYFVESRSYFKKAQGQAQIILKKFSKFNEKDLVYYILAYNAVEFQKDKKAKSYFSKSMRSAKKTSLVYERSSLGLARIYYNDGKFKKALPLYERALRVKRDRWWTKESYNLSWCYFKSKRYKKAIDTMLNVYEVSKNPEYINMRASVEKDMAYFYTEGGNIKDAISFYKRNGLEIFPFMMKMAKYLLAQNKFTSVERLLGNAFKIADNNTKKIEINFILLNLYEKFGKWNKHLSKAKNLLVLHEKDHLNKGQVKKLIYQVQKRASSLQKSVASKIYRGRPKVRQQKARDANSYFVILKKLTPENSYKIEFYMAETLFGAGLFKSAIALYELAMTAAQSAGSSKFYNMSSDGMLAAYSKLGRGSFKSGEMISVYERYLEKTPKTKKAFLIYQRLFNSYYKLMKIKLAENVLFKFKHNFPKSVSKQEVMLAKVMEYHKNKKDYIRIKFWVNKIDSGEFKVSNKYARQVKLLLASMKFEDVEKANASGNKVKALEGYLGIYNDPKSSRTAKKNASYNIMVLFHELGDVNKTYHWFKSSLVLMRANDTNKFGPSFLTVAAELFNTRQYKKSAKAYESVFNKVCLIKSKLKKSFFKNAYVIYLAEGDIDKAYSLIISAARCQVPPSYLGDAKIELLKMSVTFKRWDMFNKVLNLLESNYKYYPAIIYSLNRLYETYHSKGRDSYAVKIKNKILKYYNISKSKRLDIPLESLDIISKFKIENLRPLVSKLSSIKLIFPEKKFNQRLKIKLKILDTLTSNALEILKIGSGKGAVIAYEILIISYRKIIAEVMSFTPPGKSADYIKSFKKAMRGVTNPIVKRSDMFFKEAKQLIYKNNILSTNNFFFFNKSNLPVRPQYGYLLPGVLMDRGGSR